MAKWRSDWGDEFDNEEDAHLDAKEHMDWNSYKDELIYILTIDQILDWAREQEGFYDAFQDELAAAEGEFFLSNYHVEEN